MKELEIEGKNVTLAVEKGLSELGLRRDQVEVEVLQEAAPGFLGLGTKLARVRIREKLWGEPAEQRPPSSASPAPPPKRVPAPVQKPVSRPLPAPGKEAGIGHAADFAKREEKDPRPVPRRAERPGRVPQPRPYPSRPRLEPRPVPPPPADTAEACSQAKLLLEDVLKRMGFEGVGIRVSWDAPQVRVYAELETPESSGLSAESAGRWLESLQFLVTLIASRRLKHPVAVQVDLGGYWKEKEESILLQVHQAMEMVKRTGEPVRLKPMDAVMRRLIHKTLTNHPEFESVSEGEGIWRKVVLKPKRR